MKGAPANKMDYGELVLLCAALIGATGPGYSAEFSSTPLKVGREGRPGFRIVPAGNSGLVFTNTLSDEAASVNRILENGSGVALGDIDGDGNCDVFLCALQQPNRLYRNLGNWRFQDVTDRSGVSGGQNSTAAAFADVDGDSDLDLLVNSVGGGTRLFFNEGRGHFIETRSGRLNRTLGATSMALADIDGDSDLDLYVTNYRTTTFKDSPPGLKVEARMNGGKIVVTPEDRFLPLIPRSGGVEVLEKGERDFLYLNDGKGNFSPVSWTAGAFLDENGAALSAPPVDWGLSVMFRDLNLDRAPDLYVCNDFVYWKDRVWINQQSAGFKAIDSTSIRSVSLASMAIDIADINRDGFDDLFVVDMLSRVPAVRHRQRPNMLAGLVDFPIEDAGFRPEVARNTLLLNRGDDTYAEIAQLSGVEATGWSWGCVFMDVDLDGFEDLLVVNGNNHDVQDADVLRRLSTMRDPLTPENRVRNLRLFPRLELNKVAFRNNRDLTFSEVSKEWGFDSQGIATAIATADLDNDGDLDAVVSQLNGPTQLYENTSTADRIHIRLKGAGNNTAGIGARVRVTRPGMPDQSQEMIAGGRYLSCDAAGRAFAANGSSNLTLEVQWRSGAISSLSHVAPNHAVVVNEPAGRATRPPRATDSPVFEDVSRLLKHVHVDSVFDDFSLRPLQPRKLSNLGPAIAWSDLNGDGYEDLIVGAGGGGRVALLKNDNGKGFKTTTYGPVELDVAGLVPVTLGASNVTLLAAMSNYEDPTRASRIVSLESAALLTLLEDGKISAGPMAVVDVDGDGDLDVFIGARTAAGAYPRAGSSILLIQENGKLRADTRNSAVLSAAGLVCGATFSDLDGDSDPDLILGTEWGPIRVMLNERGFFTDRTEAFGLHKLTGWWTGVATGDFDHDGQVDIVAANWGRNSRYQRSMSRGVRMYVGDFDGNPATTEALEVGWDQSHERYVPYASMDQAIKAIPALMERISSYQAYGEAPLAAILGLDPAKTQMLESTTHDSMVLLRRGAQFEKRPLPTEAQFAPAFGVCISDYDGDGHDDLFLAQNFFGVDLETGRSDGGRGLWLRGLGDGNFSSVAGQTSGVKIYGEQRGAAVCDFDHDGRPDLAVGVRGGETRLFHNKSGRPGLRVVLKGSAENPFVAGASLQAFDDRGNRGVFREVKLGSGYWSTDSPVQIMTCASPVSRLDIRWPDGTRQTVNVPRGVPKIEISRAIPTKQ